MHPGKNHLPAPIAGVFYIHFSDGVYSNFTTLTSQQSKIVSLILVKINGKTDYSFPYSNLTIHGISINEFIMIRIKSTSHLVFLACTILGFLMLSCNNSNQNPDNYLIEQSASGKEDLDPNNQFFKISEDTLSFERMKNVQNLEIKYGFRNIKLGSYFSDYKFNPKEYKISSEFGSKLILCYAKFRPGVLVVNGVNVNQLDLLFFNDRLILIKILGEDQNEDKQQLLSLLTEIYGENGMPIAPSGSYKIYGYPFQPRYPIYKYLYETTSFKKQNENKKNDLRDMLKNAKKHQTANDPNYKNLNLPSTVLYKDPDSDKWYNESEPTYQYKWWNSKNVRLVYKFQRIITRYYKDVEEGDLPTFPGDVSVSTNETMILMLSKEIEKATAFIEEQIAKSEKQINDSIEDFKKRRLMQEAKGL